MPKDKLKQKKGKKEYFIRYVYGFVYVQSGTHSSSENTAIITGNSAKEAVKREIAKIQSKIKKLVAFDILDIKRL